MKTYYIGYISQNITVICTQGVVLNYGGHSTTTELNVCFIKTNTNHLNSGVRFI